MAAHAGAAVELRSCSLEELKQEPWRLQIQAENASEQLRGLVLKNYHVFIQSNQCASVVKDDVRATALGILRRCCRRRRLTRVSRS